MTVRAILFDVGDTLLRVGEFPADLGPQLADIVECDLERDDLAAACSRAAQALRSGLLASFAAGQEDEPDLGTLLVPLLAAEGLPVSPAQAQALGDVFGRADIGRLEPRDGVVETLRELTASGHRLAAVSNTTTRPALLNALFEEQGLATCFESWTYSAALGVRKPHPRLYTSALGALGVSGAESVFVGDRVREDILGPRRAGIAHAVLTHEYRQEDPGDSDPCAVITRLEDLREVLTGLR
jgi:HAD superfamily hydrolase (TIGR01509 family)